MNTTFILRETAILSFFVASQVAQPQTLPLVIDVDLQPLKAQIERLIQATDYLGEPSLPKPSEGSLERLAKRTPRKPLPRFSKSLIPNASSVST